MRVVAILMLAQIGFVSVSGQQHDWFDFSSPFSSVPSYRPCVCFGEQVVCGQDEGGAGAGDAVDPSVPLTQIQFQNVFVPSTHDASGYSNQFVLQPVIPLNISKDGFFPYHIIRPTLPIIAPTADPDGAAGTRGGIGDLTVLDVYAHPMECLKTNVGIGYAAVLPTRTHPQLGRGEWQVGPAAFAITRLVPKWVIGAIYQMPFSTQSDAYSAQVQLIATRLLEDDWYIGWGDQLWTIDDQDSNYNLPLQARIGRVTKVCNRPVNIFLQGFYTPDGMRSGPADEWGIKLSVAPAVSADKVTVSLVEPLGRVRESRLPVAPLLLVARIWEVATDHFARFFIDRTQCIVDVVIAPPS